MAEAKFVRLKHKSAADLKSVCDAYFARIDEEPPHMVRVGTKEYERRVPYTPAGLARALGISTQTLGKYLRGEVQCDGMSKKTESEVLHVLTAARMKIEDDITTKALLGEVDNAIAKQVMGMLGYNKSMDEAGEEANSTVRVIVEGATKEDLNRWAK